MHTHSSYTVVFHHIALSVHCGEQHDCKSKKRKQATTLFVQDSHDCLLQFYRRNQAITNPIDAQILTAYVFLFMNYRANAQFAQTLQQTTCTTLPSYILTYTCSVCVLKIESQADENSDELRTRNELRTKQQADMVHYKLIELRILQEQKMNCSITVIP
jgi:hypothetical protein